MPRTPPVLALSALVALAACADSSATADPADGAPVTLTLGSAPLLEVGVLEGDEAYQLHDVRAAALLPDGGVAVANQGSREVRVYGADGRFRVASGGDGDGPGEWRYLTEIDHLAGDTVAVTDLRLRRVGFVSAEDGSYLGTADPERTARLQPPVSFHAGLLIEGVGSEDLAVLGPVLRTVDVFEPGGAASRIRVQPDGTVLVLPLPSGGAEVVRVFDLTGRHRASVPLPPGFTPLQVTEDRLVGVQRDAMDVERLQVWELGGGRAVADGPSLAEALEATPDTAVRPDASVPAGEVEWARAVYIGVASAQEIHYAGNGAYTGDLSRLDTPERPLELPEGVEVQILSADASGWMGRFVHRETRTGCFLAYGLFRLPEGVSPGESVCWADR